MKVEVRIRPDRLIFVLEVISVVNQILGNLGLSCHRSPSSNRAGMSPLPVVFCPYSVDYSSQTSHACQLDLCN